ncbi:chemotaxis protein CheB [Flammeovirga sp. OC4]|uniref:chemotaxis protein CheB n=1 Tax=Flammeovirga sp. OC4 TaxID=1382345 RepID=UPI0005C4CB3A|nr:chemotaxis protein CheB [Flammeovirga sp. OC4]
MTLTDKTNYVVGIGASAGGLEAIKSLFENYHSDLGIAFVIVQHLSQSHKSLMPELLQKITHLPVIEVNSTHSIEPNHIYIINNHSTLTIKKKMLINQERNDKQLTFPINTLFSSLAEEYKKKAIGVILSGTGSDGTEGLKAIKEHGGITFVQHPNSAKFNGMPFSAIKSAKIDFIISAEEIADSLSNIINGDGEINLSYYHKIENILDLIGQQENIDYSAYKPQTLYRRVLKMMEYQNITSINEYYSLLENSPFECRKLAQSFLIGVTSFFRDGDEWDYLEKDIIPKIIQKDVTRIWSIGCSLGHEAYSIAMMVLESVKDSDQLKEIKIFATDLNAQSIQKASEGIYTTDDVKSIPKLYVSKYFDKIGSYYHVKESLRNIITFVQHDILSTPPFLNIDLVICRNLLIYLKPKVQQQILNTIKFSLNKNGFLFLGPSEKNFSDKYLVEENAKHKFFKLTEKFRGFEIDKSSNINTKKIKVPKQNRVQVVNKDSFEYENIEKQLIEYYCQPIIVINEKEQLVFSSDEVGKYLKFPKNELVLKEVFDFDVYIDIVRTINKAKEDGKNRKISNLKLQSQTKISTDIIIRRLKTETNDDLFILEFFDGKEHDNESVIEQDSTIKNLKSEIKHLHQELKIAHKRIERINEDYQVNNEELMSSNEELQSSNEELQSVNEELYTVNQEYKDKLDEISVLNDDFINLFQSAGIASLYLDKDFSIRRIAPNTSEFFGIEKEDIGRNIMQFNTFFEIEGGLLSTIEKAVLENKVQEHEVKTKEDRTYLLRVSPSGDRKSNTDGIILSFIPISSLKPIQILQRKNSLLKEQLSHYIQYFSLLNIETWNWVADTNTFNFSENIKQLFKFDHYDSFLWRNIDAQLQPENSKLFSEKINKCLNSGHPFDIVLHINDSFYNFICLAEKNANGKTVGMYGSIENITNKYNREKSLEDITSTYQGLSELNQFGTIKVLQDEPNHIKVNDTLLNWLGLDSLKNTIKIEDFISFIHPDDHATCKSIFENVENKFDITIRVERNDGQIIYLNVTGLNKSAKNANIKVLAIVFDNTYNKSIESQWEETVELAEKTAQTLAVQNEQLESYTYIASHNIRSPLSNLLALMELYQNEEKQEAKENYLTLFEKALVQLENTVNNLTDAIKVQQKTKLERQKIGVKDELMKVLDILSGQINKYGVVISLDVEKDLTINYHEEYLKSIFLNLLSNSIKYRAPKRLPKIEVEAYQEKKFIYIKIKDNGRGIDLKKYGHRIFGMNQTFHHNEDARGLGLFLTKTQIEATGGNIQVSSEVDQGTTFSINIPKE